MKHYKELKIDTFELWRQNKTPQERLVAAEFNIHKYVMRKKGCDYEDFLKIKAYAEYALDAMRDMDKEAEEMANYFGEVQNEYSQV